MKAMIYTKYGSPDVLEFKDVPKPIPKDNQVLIKVHAASLNAADSYILRGNPMMLRLMYGLFKPKNPILGSDVAGVIEAIGSNVTQFKVGDAVFGDLAAQGLGGFAEYVCAGEDTLALKPDQISFEMAAAVPMAGFTALSGLRDFAQIQAGQKVLIHGASGGVGTFAVQLAKFFGAEVTAVGSQVE
jgi:NADPH:quinone reductase-like Zn-dependent oxidoreductase